MSYCRVVCYLLLSLSLLIWNLRAQSKTTEARSLGKFEPTSTRRQHFGFSRGGSYFYSIGEDGTLTIWDTLSLVKRFTSRDVKLIATAPDDGRILICDGKRSQVVTSTDGKVVSTLQKPITRERQAVWSSSGDLVAGWISKYDVGVFSAGDGNLLQVLKTHTRKKLAIQRFFDFGGLHPGIHFSPNGRTILTVFGDTEAELWDVKSGIRIYTFDDALRRVYTGAPLSREPVNDGEISPDGRWVYTSSYEGGRIWDLETGRLVNQFDGFQFAHFSPDGMYLGPFNTKGSDATQVLDLQIMKLRPLGASFAGRLGIWSPDGRWIITDRTIDEVNRQEAYFFQVDSGEMLWSTKTYAKYCVDLISTCISDSDTFTFSPNSRLLAVSNMKSVKIVDSQSGDLLKIVDGVAGPVAWNPDSRLILCRRAKGGELLLYEIQA